ncbi:MAG: COX15/CtaA family protein, partial [Acidiferrobacterales bacterium]
ATMFVLGGMQGLLGWFMVKSGLVDRPHVSQYRLTAHLSLAIAIYGYMLWVALGLLLPKKAYAASDERALTSDMNRLRRGSIALWVLISVMIISGGFVAGTHAGFVYNTFPTMNGYWFPPGLYGASPWYHNLFDDLTSVQFNHRILAYTIFVSVIAFVLWARNLQLPKPTMTAVYAVLAAMLLQVTLGISTLLTHVAVPVGAAHQGGALVLFTTVAVLVRLFHIPTKSR